MSEEVKKIIKTDFFYEKSIKSIEEIILELEKKGIWK